ncbi:MarR family winged helix-turn-helix transcriptional regulator [Clostridium folliculivorans]|uniref:MarR family transcriptional regulator n=1 Tax=Clostridium folliculivorans TaxID=2886038 RepID=A0A9W5XZ66_9CLOT|nr:MarR family transcriptional regulator [Clostridium folliculivorans]GKU23784.1 MarR family transcriptional regulator [Clostridium folliculivorans]GKU29900.1 MarR family transcriptional regulator [Clostridium folliculivorans]
MDDGRTSLIKLVSKLYRLTQAQLDVSLERFNLTSGMYPYILILYNHEGISQNCISKKLNVDKAMSARTIKRLIELDYIRKEADQEDSRAYRLFLTEKSRKIIPEIKQEIQNWIDIISLGSHDQDIDKVILFLNNALENAKNYKMSTEEGDKNNGEYK